MVDSIEENKSRLFALDASLRAEADRMLEESGLGEIIREEGYKAVGSYVMRTMTWLDLDFERLGRRISGSLTCGRQGGKNLSAVLPKDQSGTAV